MRRCFDSRPYLSPGARTFSKFQTRGQPDSSGAQKCSDFARFGPGYGGARRYRPRVFGFLRVQAPDVRRFVSTCPWYFAICAFRPRVFGLLRVQAPGIWASALTAPGCLRAPHVLAPNIARCGRCPRSRVVAPARAQKTGPEADAPGPDAVCPATASQAVPSRVLSSRG